MAQTCGVAHAVAQAVGLSRATGSTQAHGARLGPDLRRRACCGSSCRTEPRHGQHPGPRRGMARTNLWRIQDQIRANQVGGAIEAISESSKNWSGLAVAASGTPETWSRLATA